MALFVLLSACTSNYAPVGTAQVLNSNAKGSGYVVQRGDTLYAIAFRYNMDYRALAAANHLSAPYALEIGQVILIKEPPPQIMSPSQQKAFIKPIIVKQPEKIRWIWPAKGRIVAHYSPTVGQKGIDIAGVAGEPVYAATSGKVAYAGNGLRGYGNLIILKHNDEFLSAYAHNQKLLVQDGQEVKAGQMIATMGNTESKRVLLHFEIREAGKSVNPLIYVKP